MAKTIELTQGYAAIVDDEDYEMLSKHKWCVFRKPRTTYARTWLGGKNVSMHRLILDAPPGEQVDHINGDGLDNRRHNIRLCTIIQNSHNHKTYQTNTSGYKGVSWNKQRSKWRAMIMCDGKSVWLGYFADLLRAAQAYDAKAKELYGEFARPNFQGE